MSPTPEQAVQAVNAYKDHYISLLPEGNFDRVMWERLEIKSASVDEGTGKVTFSIKIPSTYSNYFGNVHGGCIATLFDGLTSSTLSLQSGWVGKEVSRDLQVKFYRPIGVDEAIDAVCEVVHAGTSLATVRGQLRRARDGALLAGCVHEKFNPSTRGQSKL